LCPTGVLIVSSRPFYSWMWQEYPLVSGHQTSLSDIFKLSTSSRIIHDLEWLQDTGLALMTYFYFDFKDPNKQQVNGLLASCIAQLSAKSNACYNILSALYSKYDHGSRRPEDDALMNCLANMLEIKGQPTIYIIIDAIDECPNSPGQ
jgi:hypothetical protein